MSVFGVWAGHTIYFKNFFSEKKEFFIFPRNNQVMKEPTLKEKTYEKERAFLSPYATRSYESRGRERAEPACPMRTDFQRDRDRIIYSKAFLRL